jgi:hypothetical protein
MFFPLACALALGALPAVAGAFAGCALAGGMTNVALHSWFIRKVLRSC